MFFTACGIEEVDCAIEKFGAHSDRPPFILLGAIHSGPIHRAGVLCYADDQASADQLALILGRFGSVDVEQTEWHSNPTFRVSVLRKVAWELKP